jgi:hypothetical protein
MSVAPDDFVRGLGFAGLRDGACAPVRVAQGSKVEARSVPE